MTEDKVLTAVTSWLVHQGWCIGYLTRTVTEGAIGGVDAILLRQDPWRFCFVDAKGAASTPARRARNFTNALGALIKRVRFEQGYLANEERSRFVSACGLDALGVRAHVATLGVHKNSQYVLALTADYVATVQSGLDPALASLLHITVLIVTPEGVRALW